MGGVSPAVEIANLPPTVTFDDLSALLGGKAAVFSLKGDQLSTLVLVESAQAAREATDLLNGADWGGRTLSVTKANAGRWLASNCAAMLAGKGVPASFSAGAGSRGSAPGPPPRAQQQFRAPPPPAASQPAAFHEAHLNERAPGFELPDWDWNQAAGGASGRAAGTAGTTGSAAAAGGPRGAAGGSWEAAGGSWQDPAASSRPARPQPNPHFAGRGGGLGGRGSRLTAAAREKGVSLVPTPVLWIGNIGRDVTDREVGLVFGKFGRLCWTTAGDARIAGVKNLRYAIACFARQEDAERAFDALNKKVVPELGGLPIKIKYKEPSAS